MLNVGVYGLGGFGKQLVGSIQGKSEKIKVVACAARTRSNVEQFAQEKGIDIVESYAKLLADPRIQGVILATPHSLHPEHVQQAARAGKHVFVEKPFTYTVDQAEELINLAERKNLKIMVDHTFLFTGSVRKMKQLVDDGTLGKIYYYDSMRVNLGLFQHDVNVIWDLAPHDLAIMFYVLGQKPNGRRGHGLAHVKPGMEDMAYLTFYFDDNVIAHVNVNWLSPVKVRTTLVGGQKKMLVWNDNEPDEKIKIYDKGVEVKNAEGVYNLLVSYRSGDVWAPKVDQTEALKAELGYFVDCVIQGSTPFNDGEAGLRVVSMLEAADRSMAERGRVVPLG